MVGKQVRRKILASILGILCWGTVERPRNASKEGMIEAAAELPLRHPFNRIRKPVEETALPRARSQCQHGVCVAMCVRACNHVCIATHPRRERASLSSSVPDSRFTVHVTRRVLSSASCPHGRVDYNSVRLWNALDRGRLILKKLNSLGFVGNMEIVIRLDISRRSKGEEVCVVIGTILDKD